MKIEVITTGDEVLSGSITDTNFAWIADQLWTRGYDLVRHTTVADDREAIGKALIAAAGASDVVIVTGGLGPTTDDITLEAAAEAFGLPLELNSRALAEIEGFFQKVGRSMSPNNRRQAMLPQGSSPIANCWGTAPGCHLQYQQTDFFFLPGVPKEMKQQFEEAVLPFLQKLAPGKAFHIKVFRCFGVPEAALDQELRQATLGPVRLGWRVVFPEILVKISSTDPSEGERHLEQAERVIREKIGRHIYAEGDETIERVIGRLLTVRKERLAVAESCTGGLIAHMITNVPGSSNYFERGVVTYSNKSKSELLGVNPELFKTAGAVSPEVATAMAEGARKISGTTYGIGVTGVAGGYPEGLASPPPPAKPDGASPSTSLRDWSCSKPVGTVYIAVAGPRETKEKRYDVPRDREWFKLYAAHIALHKLRRLLLPKK